MDCSSPTGGLALFSPASNLLFKSSYDCRDPPSWATLLFFDATVCKILDAFYCTLASSYLHWATGRSSLIRLVLVFILDSAASVDDVKGATSTGFIFLITSMKRVDFSPGKKSKYFPNWPIVVAGTDKLLTSPEACFLLKN